MAKSFWSLGVKDYSKETSRVTMRTADMTDGASLTAIHTAVAALETAIIAVTMGSVISQEFTQDRQKYNVAPPIDPHAQRENKWMVTAISAAGNISKMELPCADLGLTDILLPNSDVANWTGSGASSLWTDFVTAFQAAYRDKNGATVTVQDIRFVGRDL